MRGYWLHLVDSQQKAVISNYLNLLLFFPSSLRVWLWYAAKAILQVHDVQHQLDLIWKPCGTNLDELQHAVNLCNFLRGKWYWKLGPSKPTLAGLITLHPLWNWNPDKLENYIFLCILPFIFSRYFFPVYVNFIISLCLHATVTSMLESFNRTIKIKVNKTSFFIMLSFKQKGSMVSRRIMDYICMLIKFLMFPGWWQQITWVLSLWPNFYYHF